ncbi:MULTISPECIES: gamma-glutamyltransferase [Nitrospirillum]|uniref:Glutathione hydrolase proenzyme n=1 Tax=Nitrospirillum amazonense TaxID=28077 RepID=A0A560FZF8_9PROT|nr:gamma-glutamyltransferase [Nitrospirillum amazonense]MEC4591159.1 gamma-glutamyltransferase [Nitrospirillum amazonense]TWB27033.1 gamma-glutamyltransferase 1 [Nitrospirillum amazonense]
MHKKPRQPAPAFTRRPFTAALLAGALVLAPLAAVGPAHAQGGDPELASPFTPRPVVRTKSDMVVAANPLAAEAGHAMLRQGGSAVDAAIAVQLVLGLVEPQSSGLGGGGYMLIWDPKAKKLVSLDGRETAPAGSTPDRFVGPDGRPMPLMRAFDGGRAVGTPGIPALLAEAHKRYGKLPWTTLFQPAIQLARDGFVVSPRLALLLKGLTPQLKDRPDMLALFFHTGPDGSLTPLQAGETFRNPAMAHTLEVLAAQGPDAYYHGILGQDLAKHLADSALPANTPGGAPALVTAQDLAAYKVEERDPLCTPYRQWKVCSMGPSSSGGIAIVEMLGLLEHFDMKGLGKDSPTAWHLMVEASRLAYADRDLYVGDPAFVTVPKGLLDKGYLAERARLIDPAHAAKGPVAAGVPPQKLGALYGPGWQADIPSTSHMSLMDDSGMAVSFTTSVEFAFGSGMAVDGYVLNNQLTDFSFIPTSPGTGLPVANAVAAGKRPRSSMAPTIVFDETGKPMLLVGSPGGPAIIGYVAETIVAALDWGLDAQEAVSLPRIVNRNGTTALESGPWAPSLKAGLEALGQTVELKSMPSGLHVIKRTATGLEGGVDPRREGLAAGD